MAGTGRKWLVGCGVGCAVSALLAILVTVGGGLLLTRPFDRAADTQRELSEVLGAREDYTPPLAGLTGDQLRRFLAVRREVSALCPEFREIAARFEAMERLDRADEEPSVGELLGAVGGAMSGAMGMVANLGRFTEVRNRALLAEGMSLGEYVWIYVLAYNAWLGHPPNAGFEEGQAGSYTRGERRVIRRLLENHAASLEEAGLADAAAAWRAEAGDLAASATGVPFADGGLPEALAARLAPLRDKLEDVYCAETSSFELAKIRKQGLSYHSE